MSMNVGSSGPSNADPEPMMDVNMTPLIDVMLVLIIMLIITIPKQNHAVNLNMPVNNNAPPPTTLPVVHTIDIDFDGTISWDGVTVQNEGLKSKLNEVSAIPDQPEVHVRPNKLAEYKYVAGVMAAAQRMGVNKIGMVGNEQFINP
jgi:biopolymer transport protein ExbD